jgi:hypothetical protein
MKPRPPKGTDIVKPSVTAQQIGTALRARREANGIKARAATAPVRAPIRLPPRGLRALRADAPALGAMAHRFASWRAVMTNAIRAGKRLNPLRAIVEESQES